MDEAIVSVLKGTEGWLRGRRWFGDKSRQIERFEPFVHATIERPEGYLALTVVDIAFAEGESARYFVPVLVSRDGPGDLDIGCIVERGENWFVNDALITTAFQRWFMEMASSNSRIDGPAGSWRWRSIGSGVDQLRRAVDERASVLSGEQSNTSLRYGRALVAKVFRRLQPGINPDIEIGGFLKSHAKFAHVPPLLGEAEMRDDRAWSVAAIQAFQENQGDGWSWLLASMRGSDDNAMRSTWDALGLLGERTAELHIALATDSVSESFRPEPYDAEILAADSERLNRELKATLQLLRQSDADALSWDTATDRLAAVIDGLECLRGTVRIRVHGDYHLGQVLRTTDNDFSILDFEGEPSRPLAERRQKAAALRDVAGMLRSFDYARATLARESRPGRFDDGHLARWAAGARQRFLDRYLRRVADATVPIIPATSERFHGALAALELEKALYEVRYELNNRPDWAPIPLDAIRAQI